MIDFERCHAVGALVREYLGYGPDSLADGAPRSSLVFKNWHAMLEHEQEFNRLKMPLRLPFAIRHNLQPGLWKPADVTVAKADQTFAAKLRNLASASGVVGAAS